MPKLELKDIETGINLCSETPNAPYPKQNKHANLDAYAHMLILLMLISLMPIDSKKSQRNNHNNNSNYNVPHNDIL